MNITELTKAITLLKDYCNEHTTCSGDFDTPCVFYDFNSGECMLHKTTPNNW